MIRGITLLIVLLVVFSCKEKSVPKNDLSTKSETNQRDIRDNKDWKLRIVDFQPDEINLSRNQFLLDESLNNFLSDSLISQDDKEYVVNVILLKQYSYHLKRSHQGYNLLSMRSNKSGKAIIDYFLKQNSISPNEEFVNSGAAHLILKDKPNEDEIIIELIKKIDAQIAALPQE
ncbi:MAG: hypothetical protein AAF554_03645 [Bacteroidota bacterium]